jgi:hypothetical protein
MTSSLAIHIVVIFLNPKSNLPVIYASKQLFASCPQEAAPNLISGCRQMLSTLTAGTMPQLAV